jgi:hypothetical protein
MVKKYTITAAQARASPHGNFIEGLKTHAKNTRSEVRVLPMIGESAKEDMYPPTNIRINGFKMQYSREKLNNNLQIEQFDVKPWQVDPVTGLWRFAQRSTSVIFASPKQRLVAIPHSTHKIPKFEMTTGACTYPNYASGTDNSAERRRIGGIAKRDHVYGAIIAEILDDEIFFTRNIRADTRGKFIDLGIQYDGEDTRKARLEALVLGDWHPGYTDLKVKEASYDIIRTLNPLRIFLHDFFDGHSISPFKPDNLIIEGIIQGSEKGYLSLEDELACDYKELIQLSKVSKGKDIFVVASNHNEFLEMYLNRGRFIHDSQNAKLAFQLASAYAREENPVEAGLKICGGDLPKNIHFLKRKEDFKILGYQLGAHGDGGRSGKREAIHSGIQTREKDYGASITGHSHSAGVLRNTYIVGTSTPLVMFYNEGRPTNWSNSVALLWETGAVQMVHIIDGKWGANSSDSLREKLKGYSK